MKILKVQETKRPNKTDDLTWQANVLQLNAASKDDLTWNQMQLDSTWEYLQNFDIN